MQRPTSGFERALAYTSAVRPLALVGSIQLRPAPPPEGLREALTHLQRRHPLLRARLAGPAGAPTLQLLEDAPPLPLEVLPEGSPPWLELVERMLGAPGPDGQAPLLRFKLLPAAEGAHLLFRAHHLLLDGASAVKLLDELLRRCAGVSAPDDPLPLGPTPAARFPNHLRGLRRVPRLLTYAARELTSELAYRLRTRAQPAPDPPGPQGARSRALALSLPLAETRALVRATRSAGLSLNSALAAAALLAVWRLRYGGRARPLQTVSFANLRPYLEPPLPAQHLGCYASMLRASCRLGPAADLASVAADLQRKMLAAGKRGEKFLAAALSGPLMRALLTRPSRRMGTTALSYLGPVRLQPSYGPFEVLDLHGFISNIDIGPEFTALAFMRGGELQWDVVYLEGDMGRSEAQALGREMLGELRAFAREAGYA